MKNIGTRMRKIREAQGKKQYAVAVEAGITQSAYARIESGQRVPPIKTLNAIAKSLGVQFQDLYPTTGNWIGQNTIFGLLIQHIRYSWGRYRCNKSTSDPS